MNRERFKRIIDFMENVPEEKFNFNKVQSECGTYHCILGFFPQIFPEENIQLQLIKNSPEFVYPFKNNDRLDVSEFLEIDELTANLLTDPVYDTEAIDLYPNYNLKKDSSLTEVLNFWKFYYENN